MAQTASFVIANDSGLAVRVRINEVLAAHFLDRQKAHQRAAGKPDQHLRADHQRQPFVNLAGPDVEATRALHRLTLFQPASEPKPNTHDEVGI